MKRKNQDSGEVYEEAVWGTVGVVPVCGVEVSINIVDI